MSERKYNTSRYIYTGPGMLLPWAKPSKYVIGLNSGNEVVAEMNIGKATVIAVHKLDYDFMTEPTYIASEYLKPRPIHFDPKDDYHGTFDMEWFKEHKLGAKNCERMGNVFEDLMQAKYHTPKKVMEYIHKHWGDKEPSLSDPIGPISEETGQKLVRLYEMWQKPDNIEVGGDHYQTAIQPWDFIYANHIPFDEANCIKYLCRHKDKGGAEDIKKVISYCKHILKTQYHEDD